VRAGATDELPRRLRSCKQAAAWSISAHAGRIVRARRDRKTFLHALLTNDIALLGAGTGCYAALLTRRPDDRRHERGFAASVT